VDLHADVILMVKDIFCMEQRKNDHISLAFTSQADSLTPDERFNYEPLTGCGTYEDFSPFPFLGKSLKVPVWVSSMTGGSQEGKIINQNLARACNEFGMGMGLGSCRILFDKPECFSDFHVRPILGPDLPLYANIGIVQVEEMIQMGNLAKLEDLVHRLDADGIIIHVNPIQEWLQREGRLHLKPAIETIESLLMKSQLRVVVKEVGQGMGPESISQVMKLPIEAFEFASYGGTNFAKIELSRGTSENENHFSDLTNLGHGAEEMLDHINSLVAADENLACRQLIISGGIRNFLDGYYFLSKSKLPSIYGQALGFLQFARGDYRRLQSFVSDQLAGLQFAKAFLKIKKNDIE